MPYMVSLVDCTDSMSNLQQVREILQGWFNRAAATHQPPMTAVVEINNTPTPASDIVIYFVANFHRTVLHAVGRFGSPPNWSQTGGLTVMANHSNGAYRPGSIHGSEVYLDKWDNAQGVAMAAFHEALHNQLRVGNEMHVEFRNYGGGIAAEFPDPGTEPNEDNLRRIGMVMDLRHAQLLTGYAHSHRRGR